MPPTPLPAELRAAAPALAAALRLLLTGLATLIARGLLKHPRHVGIILPLWNRLTRAARRFDSLMARAVAGTHHPRLPSPNASPGAHSPAPARLPTQHAWLLLALKHEAAHYTNRLLRLLEDPANAALIAAIPQAQSLLRPICHMLGVRHASLGVRHASPGITRPTTPKDPRPPSPPPALAGGGRGEGGATPRTRPCEDPPALLPRPPPELCPRLLTRWPFAPWRPRPA